MQPGSTHRRCTRRSKWRRSIILRRMTENEFLRSHVLLLSPENGRKMLRKLPRRADFCGAIMGRVYFEHCVKEIRRRSEGNEIIWAKNSSKSSVARKRSHEVRKAKAFKFKSRS
mmetsp:Transcript_16661/g.31596  ORF Transcript_16661/g.31596 Transcript_16661/m.31596 type:complete len:114 (-) Transcript_16661:240-581(-)